MTTPRRLLAPSALALLAALAWPPAEPADPVEAAFDTIEESDLWADLQVLASPAMEGRDSPSTGLTRAAEYVATRFTALGYEAFPAPDGEAGAAGAPGAAGGDGADGVDGFHGGMIRPFTRELPAPDPERCVLASEEHTDWELGRDFVPVVGASGVAQGEVVFVGFGIDDSGERYDDVPGDLRGKIALILEGEPRHRKKFEGPEVTPAADLYAKLTELRDVDAEGVLVVRRPPSAPDSGRSSRGKRGSRKASDDVAPSDAELAEFGFRHTWASWVGDPTSRGRFGRGGRGGRGGGGGDGILPALEITPAVADALLGESVLELAATIDAKAKAPRPLDTGREVTLSSHVLREDVPIENVVAWLPGSDPELADEYVVIGAHLDHVGVDARGRIGLGADDNASGVAAMIEVAEALAQAGPRRSVILCAFGAEEDGLMGSRAFVDRPPVPQDAIVAMLNMDMVGRGGTDKVIVLGVEENPKLGKLLKRANKLHATKVRKIVTNDGQTLFQRSDHYPFHLAGIPALFFFEDLPIDANEDYHTWRDTLDKLNLDKIARTARLVFNTAWLLCDEDERPPPPR